MTKKERQRAEFAQDRWKSRMEWNSSHPFFILGQIPLGEALLPERRARNEGKCAEGGSTACVFSEVYFWQLEG